MTETNDRFKKAPRKQASPGKRVSLSAEARQAYEDLVRTRDERDRTYGQHLPAENKGK
ncbi:hypothetical protein [Kaistia terrae]|jgi:hypothetical protein|uniref:Uncharacterized protein n=1 Tax=Kaistia terrae TaxID=537017 RepID=A0ABW0PP98_9HYPH|nr:hypothetical protein [Kaistia terrae]MCX5580121.1 hypothetical protein [Kaistia terrae]